MKKKLFLEGIALIFISQSILCQFDTSSFTTRYDISDILLHPGNIAVSLTNYLKGANQPDYAGYASRMECYKFIKQSLLFKAERFHKANCV